MTVARTAKMKAQAAGVAALIAALLTLAAIFYSSPSHAETVTLNGFNCTKVDKTNGGFTLDCEPGGTPSTPSSSASSSASASPSATPTATSSPNTPSPSSTTPSPSNTPSPTGTGTSFPQASTTGVPPGTTLTPMAGTTIRTAGTVVDGKDISGCLTVAAPNVTIRNSRVTAGGCNTIRSNSTGLVIENVEVSCSRSQGTGIGGSGYTARRVNVHDCENGFDTAGQTSIVDSYVHDLWHGTDGHTDGVQVWSGSTGITITHNTIINQDPNGTSAIIGGDNTGVTVSGNRLVSAGGYTLYCAPGSAAFRVVNNRISRGFYGPLANCSTSQLSGNVSDETGQPLP